MKNSLDEPMELREFKILSRRSIDDKDKLEALEAKLVRGEKERRHYREVKTYFIFNSVVIAAFISVLVVTGCNCALLLSDSMPEFSLVGNDGFAVTVIGWALLWLLLFPFVFSVVYIIVITNPKNAMSVEEAKKNDKYELDKMRSKYMDCRLKGAADLHDEWMKYVAKVKELRKSCNGSIPEYDYVIMNILIDSLPDYAEVYVASSACKELPVHGTPRDYMDYAYEKCKQKLEIP